MSKHKLQITWNSVDVDVCACMYIWVLIIYLVINQLHWNYMPFIYFMWHYCLIIHAINIPCSFTKTPLTFKPLFRNRIKHHFLFNFQQESASYFSGASNNIIYWIGFPIPFWTYFPVDFFLSEYGLYQAVQLYMSWVQNWKKYFEWNKFSKKNVLIR